MNPNVRILSDGAAVTDLQALPRNVAAGQRRAKNRSATRLRALGTQAIGKLVNLRASYIRERLELRNASTQQPEAEVRARTRQTRMDRFPWRQLRKRGKNGRMRKAGISVRIKRGRAAQAIPSAFTVPLRSGKTDGAGGLGIAVRLSVLMKISGEALGRIGYEEDTEGFGGMGEVGGKGKGKYVILHSTSVRDLFQDVVESGLGDEIQKYYVGQLNAEMQRALARGRR